MCRGWLTRELAAIRPAVVVALGPIAAGALLGRAVTVRAERGRLVPSAGAHVVVTWNPRGLVSGAGAYADLVDDLRRAWLAAQQPRLREPAGAE